MSKDKRQKEIEGSDPKTYGCFDKLMDGALKVTRFIFPVLGASLTAGCNAELLDVIMRTEQASEVSPLPADSTPTPAQSEELNFEITPIEENTATQEWTLVPETEVMTETPVPTETLVPTVSVETEVEEERHVFLTEKIGYGDYQFDFEISLLNDDEIIKAAFDKYGIDSVSINEEKANARELLAKSFIYSFVETYNFQNETKVSMEEYMANPSNYPTLINMVGEGGEQEIQSITLDKIKKFNHRFTSGMDGELYMNFNGISSGYSLDGDEFILYAFQSTRDSFLDNISDWPLDEEDLLYLKGRNIFSIQLCNSLALMKYTLTPHNDVQDIVYTLSGNFADDVKKNADMLRPQQRMPDEEFIKWLKESGTFFKFD